MPTTDKVLMPISVECNTTAIHSLFYLAICGYRSFLILHFRAFCTRSFSITVFSNYQQACMCYLCLTKTLHFRPVQRIFTHLINKIYKYLVVSGTGFACLRQSFAQCPSCPHLKHVPCLVPGPLLGRHQPDD